MVVELTVAIEVKVIDHENEVFWGDLSVSVFSLELAKLFGADETRCVSIKPFEGSVRLKVSDGCQDLPHLFNRKLLVGDE